MLWVCLHEGGGPQVGEITCGGSPHLSNQVKMRDCIDRRITLPKRVTSPTWGPPSPCKLVLAGFGHWQLCAIVWWSLQQIWQFPMTKAIFFESAVCMISIILLRMSRGLNRMEFWPGVVLFVLMVVLRLQVRYRNCDWKEENLKNKTAP